MAKSPGRFRLRSKIIAYSFVPTAFILLLVALTNYFAYQQVTEEMVISRDRELTRLTASEVSASFEDFIDLLSNLAREPAVYNGFQPQQRDALASYSNQLVLFDAGVYLLDSLGKVRAAAPQQAELLEADWSDRSFFRSMVRNPGLFFSDRVREGPNQEFILAIAVPVLGRRDEFKGVVVGMFNLDRGQTSPFYGTLIKLRIEQEGQAFILDGEQNIIYAAGVDQTDPLVPIDTSADTAPLGRVDALRTLSPDGRDIVAGFAPIPRTGWTLILQQEWQDLVSSSRTYRQFLLFLLFMGVFLPTVVVQVGVRRITGPIADFTEAAQRIAAGNFSQRIEVHTGDELEDLAIQFNRMASQLKESYENLEVRVAQRTQELTALNSIASVVSQSLDLEQILPDALNKTIEVMGMQAGGVFRLDESDDYLVLVAQKNLSEELIRLSHKMPLQVSIIAEVTRQKHPVSRLTADYEPGPVKNTLEAAGWQTVVSIPLLAQEKVLGAINVLSSKKQQLTEEDLAVPAAIGQQIGVAMDNARLYNQTLEYANQMEFAKQAEEAARITAETANEAKSDFLANVSHELRTPLVSIYGFARLVRKRLNERVLPALESNDPRARRVVDQMDENLAIIISEGRRLTALINSLLDIEKIESGRMEFEMQPLDIRTVLDKGTAATASFFEDPHLELILNVPDEPLQISGDHDRLIQVIINLLSNAVKFTRQGQIVIDVRRVEDEVVISVIDQGTGIDPADFERVFEKFTQVGDTLTNKPRGTGLGLAISKEIVEKHGGRIWVTSEPGLGSTFSFSLPLQPAADQVLEE